MREHEDRAEAELEQRREEVAEPCAPEGRAPSGREARVVGDERDPRDAERDDQVHPGEERAAAAALVPQPVQVGVCRDPPGEVRDRKQRRPRSRTCGRSGGRSRSARAARARSRARRRRASRTRRASRPNAWSASADAAVAMMISSKIDQPRHCSTLSPVARYEPRWPSGARWSTIVGTRASAPISAATPSIALPISAAEQRRERAPASATGRGTPPRRARGSRCRSSSRAGTCRSSRARGGARAPARFPSWASPLRSRRPGKASQREGAGPSRTRPLAARYGFVTSGIFQMPRPNVAT